MFIYNSYLFIDHDYYFMGKPNLLRDNAGSLPVISTPSLYIKDLYYIIQ